MCEILGRVKVKDFTVIDCTPFEVAYSGATILRLFDDKGEVFETSKFGFEEFTQCFSPSESFSVVTKESIPERFLMKGNTVELV